MKIVNVIQGEYAISSSDDDAMTTVLGSCIAACVYDPVVGVGGMNHFLLPQARPGQISNVKYGAFLMELLVNELLKAGALKSRLRAKLFGGGKMNQSFGDVGQRNIEFGRRYLQNEGIRVEFEDVGGGQARRITFRPTRGTVDIKLTANDSSLTATEARQSRAPRNSEVLLF